MSETTGTRKPRRGFLRAVTRRFGTWPLFGVILVWVVLALVVFTILGWLWGEGPLWSGRWMTNWRGAGAGVGPLEVVKVSLTTIGGIGGTGYLVIKYRERASAERAERDAEQEQAEQRLLSAVQQLGSGSPQVRIAGVYSLASVADTYRGEYRQRVVSILCGYLRTQRGEWRIIDSEQDGPEGPGEDRVYVSHDGAVESTVLEVLIRHLRKRREKTKHREAVTQLVEDDQLWCDCTIDLHDAVLTEIANFRGTTFTNRANFRRATFTNRANFRGTTFTNRANFSGATFTNRANFSGATFTNRANFRRATFTNRANFSGATFTNRANFWNATFTNRANFSGATFNRYTDFEHAIFTNVANFRGATFSRSARPMGLPPKQVDEDGLPHGARWADADDEGLEAGSPDDAPAEGTGPGSADSAAS